VQLRLLLIYINILLIRKTSVNCVYCKLFYQRLFLFVIFEVNNRLSKMDGDNRWFKEIRDELCETLRERSKLIYVYELDGEQNLDDAILQTLFNGSFYLN
jgi:hypothetical protein